jgi:hypothetical protein
MSVANRGAHLESVAETAGSLTNWVIPNMEKTVTFYFSDPLVRGRPHVLLFPLSVEGPPPKGQIPSRSILTIEPGRAPGTP